MVKKVKNQKGLTAEKDEFSDWFTQIMLKADLADYSSVSGTIVFRPTAYLIWEKIKEETDKRFKKIGIQNVYFPLLIPERLFNKEKEHFAGFSPEVAWVTQAGNTKLKERLAIRPTSETIMYESYSKWIRSWRDLPLKYNQWNNVVRWEFKHPVPFLRTREFLWNEGHTVYATKREAEKEGESIIKIYRDICENYMALPSLIGRKSDKEKFAGAEYTTSMEFLLPNGKAIQGPDFHYDGQNFSKAYGISFLDKNGKKDYVYQNTFALSTRMLGVMFAIHSDSKGLILPPKITNKRIVIVPILFGKSESDGKVLKKAKEIEKKLSKFGVFVDDRENYKPGHKFHEWELKVVPIRIEIGPQDIGKNQIALVRRDTGKKYTVRVASLGNTVEKLLEEIQKSLFNRAKAFLYDNIIETNSLESVKKIVRSKKIAFAPFCISRKCEDDLRYKSGGAKILNIPDKQPSNGNGKCVICKSKADYWVYIGKSY